MLLSRPSPQSDETLESYLIRVGKANGYDRPKQFLVALKRFLCDKDEARFASLPIDLFIFNPCFAKQSSSSRVHAIRAMSHLVFKEPVELQQLTLNRAGCKFSPGTTGLIRQSELFPRSLLRKSHIPICPHCLDESGIARYWWHFEPYTECHIHQVQLLQHCSCGHQVNYVEDGLSAECPKCHSDYIHQSLTSDNDFLQLSSWLAGKNSPPYPEVSTSHRWGIAHWWKKQHDASKDNFELSAFRQFWEKWPQSFDVMLTQHIDQAFEYRVKELSELTCREVLGSFLFNSVLLPSRDFQQNIIFQQVVRYLDDHIFDASGHLSNLRINSIEAALILGTSLEQIAVLVEQRHLMPYFRLKSNSTLSIKADAFFLGDIFCLWLSDFQTDVSNRSIYVSRW